MIVSLTPENESLVKDRVKAGQFPSVEALVNQAVAQLLTPDNFEPGEMESLLKVGEEHAAQGRLVDGQTAFTRIKSRSDAQRGRP